MSQKIEHIPVSVGMYASWWWRNYGISYNKQYYHDPDYRVEANLKQQKILYERFGDLGMGNPNPEPNPFIDYGMVLLPEMFGCEITFFDDALPWANPADLSAGEIEKLTVPDIENSYPMTEIIRQMDYLEEKYGRVTGNINTTGILNLALKIRGDQLYIDFFENPQLVHKLMEICLQSIIRLATYVRKRTGTLASSVTPMAPPEMYVLPNCTVAQISNQAYEEFVLPYEQRLAEAMRPFGIHHCGSVNNVVEGYSKIKNLEFVEVGPNSDLRRVRELMPDVFINARIDPVRMYQCTPQEIADDVKKLIDTGGPLDKLSIDAVGVDYGTPDENIRVMITTAKDYSAEQIKAGL